MGTQLDGYLLATSLLELIGFGKESLRAKGQFITYVVSVMNLVW